MAKIQNMLIDNVTISNVVSKIVSAFFPDKVFLFGSYASGNANEDSDLDLLIIKDSEQPRYLRSIEIQRLLIGIKFPVDVLVYTNAEFEKEKTNKYSFVNSAMQSAKLLYEHK
jgi:predicted nucleotidyltransferase